VIRIALVGAAGRMGRAIAEAAAATSDVRIVACVDVPQNLPAVGGVWSDDLAKVVEPGMVVVEFAGPEGAVQAAAVCAAHGLPLVSGSTGLPAEAEAALRAASAKVAVFRASNFSVGVAALRLALRATLAAVPGEWDIEIIERHHRLKKDSPSGTALTLADDALAARGLGRDALRHGREGVVGARTGAEIGVHAVRGGTWVGDHTVLLAGPGETLELRHVAQDRTAFAHGAVAAARYVASAPSGYHGMEDLLRGPGPLTS
jgi:4-hydroxy-tetrahydrodipicolinate reductase